MQGKFFLLKMGLGSFCMELCVCVHIFVYWVI